MTTVARRTFRSTPHRDAAQTWYSIVELLTQGRTGEAKNELLAVSGIASSVIADRAPRTAPILVICDGPRTRIYCVYDEAALDDSEESENALGFDPLKGNWHISLPCQQGDLSWVQAALKKHTGRITARDLATGFADSEEAKTSKSEPLVLDPEGFLGR
jgi:hypothetical protein